MRGHINHSTKGAMRAFAIAISCLSAVQLAQAKPGGEPLLLDTQTGIHSGVPGTILQTALLNSSGMVQMDTLPNLQQDQPPIVVSPYVEYPTGQSGTSSSGYSGGRRRVPQTPHP
ncbi:hypothetical protein BUMB_01482 [Candidatus Paraburkholderia calva]|nr:hypothetical protein BUMB_01482 [Candidatus Paraburkholderia calva]